MQQVSDVSCADYCHNVREEPSFVPYFRQANPELKLGGLNIGSRPAKRNRKGGIESLRAIPWTFAWTQTWQHWVTPNVAERSIGLHPTLQKAELGYTQCCRKQHWVTPNVVA
jgi:hypothetical protein